MVRVLALASAMWWFLKHKYKPSVDVTKGPCYALELPMKKNMRSKEQKECRTTCVACTAIVHGWNFVPLESVDDEDWREPMRMNYRNLSS